MRRLAVLACLGYLLCVVATANAVAPPDPRAVAMAAAYSYAGTVCSGQVPMLEWDATGPPNTSGWVTGTNGQNCSPPIIHMRAAYWHNGSQRYLAGVAWPEFCTTVVHEYVHFTGLNWGGASEVDNPTSIEYSKPFMAVEEPAQCGRWNQTLWITHDHQIVGNPRIPALAYGKLK